MSNLAYGTFTITNLSTVTSVDVYYYNSTSSTSLSGGSWSTNAPTWTNGKYIWSKTVTTWEQGVTTESKPVCITGQKGSTGAAGQSVTKITQQYALGTSSTTAPTSGWSTTMPTFESGKFYWTRSEIVWTNPSSTTYTTAVLANGLTSANTNAETAKTDAASAVSTANTANQTANTANQTANTANQTAQNAVSIANGKNTIYYSSSKPTGGTYKAGDTWFNLTTDGYRLYEYDATAKDWVQKSMDGKSITAGTVTAAQIHAGAITTDKLATNAIKSVNYAAGTAPYSLTGTFLDLSNGNIFTPNFGVNNDSTDNIDNGAYIKGTIQAYDGKIGSDNNNYWYIGNYFDYNQGQSAMIRSHGTAAIQLGDSNTWRLSTNRIHTAWNDDSTSGEAFRLHYPTYGGKYWDSGLHVPVSATDKLLYIRNAATTVSLENLQNDINDNSGGNYWNYQFYLTNDGSLYAKNIYIMDDNGGTIQIGGTDGVYLLKSGGTISGNLEITGTLKMQGNFLNKSGSAITLQTNLASTSAVTLTGNSTSPIKLGVTGTLPVANGGTGNTNYTSGGIVYVSNTSPKTLLSNAAGTSGQLLASGGSGVPTWVNASSLTVAAATKATQDGNGKVIATTYLPLTGGNVTGPVNFGDSVSIDDLTAGTLVVTGNSSFTNNAQFNTINGITVGSSPKFTDTTYTFDGTYNASSNKAATVSTVTNAINALDVSAIAGATNKTLTSISETNGKISATYSNISITKSQVSDFPTSMPASDVSAWAKASTKPSYNYSEIQPLNTKTYNNVVMTANNDPNGWVYFAKLVPTSTTTLVYIKYRVRAEAAGINYSYNDSIVEYWIRSSTVQGYTTYNKIKHTDYRALYNHSLYRATDAGIQNEYGHLLGIRFTSSWNPATAANARTVIIDILETENCTVTFFDSMVKYADAPGTGSTNYAGRSDYDGTTQGITMSGDRNDPNYYNRIYYSSRITSAALYRYQFCLTKSDGTLVPINSVNNSVAIDKTLTIDSFDPFGQIFYWNSTSTYAENTNVGDGALYRQYLCDLRYSFNCGGYNTTPTLTARAPLYLVATPQTDGTAKLYTQPLSMELPTSADGLIYIYLGKIYPDTKPYRVALSLNHPIYEYRNGAVRLYTGLKSETAASGGTNVSLVTTGQKYLWNSKTNNTGTVTSVAASGSGGITISGSPITTSGTIAIGLNLSTAINGLGEGTSPAKRNDYIIAQYAGGGTTTTSYHRRALSNIFAALNASDITTALGYTPPTEDTNTHRPIKLDNTEILGNNTTALNLVTGGGMALSNSSGSVTIAHKDTSSQGTSTNSGRTYIQSVTLDTYGHVTGLSTATETVTDTHHTAYLYATTSTGTTNTTAAQTDPYLTLVENANARSRVQLKAGTNVTSISANAGVITFNVKDTTYTAATVAPGKVASTSAQGSSTNYARQDHTHGIDLAIGDSNGQVKIAGTNVSVKGLGSWAYKSSGSASDVGLGNVTNYAQITKIGESGDGKLRVWTGDPDGTGYTDVEVHITAYDQSTVSKAEALNLSAKIGDTNKPVYFKADGKPYAISYEINKSVPSDAVFTDHTYEFVDSYNASTNKGATVATVTNAINNLDVTAITGTAGQTITSISETNGKISATYSNISITKSQISDFPSSMTPAAHNHSQIVTIGDQRSVATTPNDYANALIFKGLKNKTAIGSPSSDSYSYLIGLRGWSDSSGGHSHEIAFNNTGIFVRQESSSTANTWDSWYQIYTTGNKPTKSDVGLGNVVNSDTTNASNITSGTLAKERLATSGATAGSYGDSGNQTPGYGSTFKVPYVTVDTYGRVTSISEHTVKIPASDNTNTWRAIQVDGADILGTGTSTNKLNLKAGTNVSLSNSNGTVTITAVDVKVTQTNTTNNADYRLLFSENANDTNSTETARKNTNLKFNPSSGLLKTYGISSAAGSTPVIYSDVSATEIKAANSSLTTSSSDSDWLKALLVALCTKYPGKAGYIFKGTMSPNSTGWYEVHIYNTSAKDSTTGLPEYSFGRFLKYLNNYELFGTSSYSYNYRTVDTNTWNALSTSQAGYVSTAPNDTTKFLRGDAQWAQVSSANLSDIRLTWSGSVSTTDWILAHDTAATGTPLFRAMSPTNLKTTMSLNNVENTALSTWAGSSNITTLGTITTGTWSGSTIAVNKGGTGKTSWTQWGVLYASGTAELANTAAGTSGYLLQGNGSAAPSWIQATNSNTASTIVKRDASGNFSAGTITAALSGTSTNATNLMAYSLNEVTIGCNSATVGASTNDTVWINYRDRSGGATDNNATKIVHYHFGNRKGNVTGVQIHAETFSGALSGNASTATKWASAQTVYVTLGTASTSTTIQGGSSSAQTIGVNGTLAIANGGTGKTTTVDAINNLLGGLPIWSANPSDSTYFIRQDTGGAASYGKVPFSTLWNYIKGKSDSTYVTLTTEQTITGRKTFSDLAAVTFKPSSGTDKCNVNYDASLGALVFSF